MTPSQAQLLVYGFGPGAEFEGPLVGAIERIESGGTLRILDVMFVMRDADTDELVVLQTRGRGQGPLAAPLVGFRLDAGERRRASEKALRADESAGTFRRLGEALEPGAAVAAVLVEHVWVRALDDAVSHTGGTPLASELVEAAAFADVSPDLIVDAATRGERRGLTHNPRAQLTPARARLRRTRARCVSWSAARRKGRCRAR